MPLARTDLSPREEKLSVMKAMTVTRNPRGPELDLHKLSLQHDAGHSSSGRGCGRGQGRGRGRDQPPAERDSSQYDEKYEDDPGISPQHKPNSHLKMLDDGNEAKETKENIAASMVRNFDPNIELNKIGDTSAATIPEQEIKHEYPGWSLADMDKMAIDPMQLNWRMDEDEDDYDEEG